MKNIVSILLLLLTASFASGQKVINDPNVEPRQVSGFHSVRVSGGIDLFVSQGDEAVAVSAADAKYIPYLKTEVDNGVLKIYYDSKGSSGMGFNDRKKLKAYVSAKTLRGLEGSGGSDIIVDGTLQASELSLQLSGGSDFKGKVSVSKLTIKQSGGSDVDITGNTGDLMVEASGASDLDGYGLEAQFVVLSASGASDINITAVKEIYAEASGASDIYWKGAAQVRKSSASGASSVVKKS